MVSVRRPVHPFCRRHGDDRIQVAAKLVDGVAHLADVRFGEIALERRGLDAVDGQRGEELPVRAERAAMGGEYGAAVVLDGLREPRYGCRRSCGSQAARGESARTG